MKMMRNDAAGWLLIEAVLLGLFVLGTAAALTLFARSALLEEYASARMEAALIARAQLSMMEADLDHGIVPQAAMTEITSNGRIYQVNLSVVRQDIFYDVHLRISWQLMGHEEQAFFVRRMRRHEPAANTP